MRRDAIAADVIETVDMDAVPVPEVSSRGKWAGVFARLVALPAGKALKVACESEKRAQNVRTQLRKVAKEHGRFLSSSREPDGATRYFWLEPESVAGKSRK